MMNPYCMDIGTEDDDHQIITRPETVPVENPYELPVEAPVEAPLVPAGV